MASITVRRPSFDLSGLPIHWVGGSRLGTWFGNAAHVFIPLGERMFIDSVREFRDRIDDAGLRDEIRAFTGQEAVHAKVHEQVWDELREHGVPVDTYADCIERVRSILEPHLPAELLLATTAALEHYTAAFGRAFLTEDLGSVLPEPMAALLAWHGAEEIEHRSVAFDVLSTVDDDVAVRLAGMAIATVLLTVVPAAGIGFFAVTEAVHRPRSLLRPRRPDPALARMTSRFVVGMVGEVARYLRPGFHPGHEPEPPGYREWLAGNAA